MFQKVRRIVDALKQFMYMVKAENSTFIENSFIMTSVVKCMRKSQQMPNIYHRYRNVIPYDLPRLNRVGAFVQNKKGCADHSQMQIVEGKTQTKKLVCRVAFQLHMCTQIP